MENDPRKGRAPESGPPLRDWQKETWFSPYPINENPFDEPEDAPELRDQRSEELNNRSGQFWETQTSGYQFGKKQPEPEKQQETRDSGPEKKHSAKLAVLISLAAAVGAALLLYYVVFSVRTVTVLGNSEIPAAEIIRMSEIRTGTPILALNSTEVERKIERNPKLVFRYLEKQLPGTVVLSVRERELCCWMTLYGIVYKMDKQRMILEETEELSDPPADLVRVDGLEIRGGVIPGQRLVLRNAEQQELFNTLFLEMKVLGCTEIIGEANLSDLNSVLLSTRDGFTVSMGNARNIHAKLRSMLLTREELLRRGYRGGVINVTVPETPVFSPDATAN